MTPQVTLEPDKHELDDDQGHITLASPDPKGSRIKKKTEDEDVVYNIAPLFEDKEKQV